MADKCLTCGEPVANHGAAIQCQTPRTKEDVDAAIARVRDAKTQHHGIESSLVVYGRTLAAEIERLRETNKALWELARRGARTVQDAIDHGVHPRDGEAFLDDAKKAGVI